MNNTLEYFKNFKPVTLDEAKKLKELGYSKPCKWYYIDTDDIPYVSNGLHVSDELLNHNEYDYFVYSAPERTDVDVIHLLGHTL